MELTGWDLRVDAMGSALCGILSAALLFPLARRTWPERPGLAWFFALMGSALALSPQHWINWIWGVQTCYTMVVVTTMAAVVTLHSGLPAWQRIAIAGGLAFAGTLSFVAGLLAWFAGLAVLLMAPRKSGTGLWQEMAGWLALSALGFFLFFHDYQPAHVPGRPSIMAAVLARPWSYAEYFLTVLGAPLSEPWPEWEKDLRGQVQAVSSMVVAVVCLGLLSILGVRIWRSRHAGSLHKAAPWLVLCGWSMATAVLIALGRTGQRWSGPLEGRYQVFLIWFHIGLTALLFLQAGRFWKPVKIAWLVLLLGAWTMGAWRGWIDVRQDRLRTSLTGAVVSMRAVGPEPELNGFLTALGDSYETLIDRLDAEGLIAVKMVPGPFVRDATMADPARHVGKLTRGGVDQSGSGLEIRGWAMRKDTRGAADAMAVSVQREGGEERWLGLAQRRIREPKATARWNAREVEDRIGWSFQRSLAPPDPAPGAARPPYQPLPQGTVTFRAYALDARSGAFTRLEGEVILDLAPPPSTPDVGSRK